MSDYDQPEFYRFNQDSLELVRWVLSENETGKSILDLGAGCGIIGYELARELRAEKLHLLELQSEYLPFLEKNRRFALPSTTVVTEINSFRQFSPPTSFDTVVSNPPYYNPLRGKVSQDARRAQARSFLVDGWTDLLRAMQRSLASEGRGYIVLKDEVLLLKEIRDAAAEVGLPYHEVSLGHVRGFKFSIG